MPDVCSTISALRCAKVEAKKERVCTRVEAVDTTMMRTTSGAPIPRVFRSCIWGAVFPQCFRPPTTFAKYARETNLGIWLEDYRLACQAGARAMT